ncbi:methionyl aminopeptidase [Anaerocolumna sp. MB42-C2]|uniref:methionyl aminopeptidase n=1 Tax=Anaerocolumna sp. MB42-C2 TaxID=3070997 RepID=UPI0027E098E6|nr:methionyl aminopeptidase [Anaerocolumna sp. MB42-C2]WMJ85943.1 methionyl aminopeptidase [Anaerocolumna sp. MB42-C2]
MRINRNDNCWCQSGKKYKYCHLSLDEKVEEFKQAGYVVPKRKLLKNIEQIKGIRESGRINTMILDSISEKITSGISTEDINTYVHEKTIQLGGIPATLGFEGFPKSVCVSINNEVCHGIPSSTRYLKDGDIVNVDVSTIYNGFYGDSSRMFCIGEISSERSNLVETARKAIEAGLREVGPWKTLGDMGQAINDFVRSKGYSVVSQVGGHGIGLEFHEDPHVSYVTKKNTEMLMVPGMVFTIEPMINRGRPEVYVDNKNGWTIYTEDGMDSAQWEIMVLITDKGYEILAH